ncbi:MULTISPECIES: SDR family oxidoreductase [unclassified Niallia]|uniref:SDR family NAD(P)-dependent oxidoreductase n=1 Tax=unclassified Niallia TaxID=2837522 RepID=UPI001EDACA39|nr:MULTISPECIES: SDR family oxidoreductase [unclassified Niallia]MDL0437367.1 SDR family oxidoreductase [Niallia sp. SS-2023]UPO86030.1 SDR family oxidoreductase [Niallia sp. Man26]
MKKNILIIGGASGIGKEIALHYAADKHQVAVADINKQSLEQLVLENGQSTLIPLEADASSWESIELLAEQIKKRFGTIHTLVYSAGITKSISLLEMDWAVWQKTLAVNLHGLFYSIKFIYPLIESGGSIVIIGSGSAITGTGGGIQYTASKGGAFGLMRSLVQELGNNHININVVAPRVIESDMLDILYPTEQSKAELKKAIPIGRLGTPIDVCQAVKYLSSEEGKYVHGQILLLDGGRTYKSVL